MPARPYALFHYVSRGSATLVLEEGRKLRMNEGDVVVFTRGDPHGLYSDRRTTPGRDPGLRSTHRASCGCSSRRRRGAALDLDLWQFHRVAPRARQRAGPAAAYASPEADGRQRLARVNSGTHGERVCRRTPWTTCCAHTNDRSSFRRGVTKLDQVPPPRRGRMASGDGRPAYRTGASTDSRASRSAMDAW
jgi:hypothetical protein